MSYAAIYLPNFALQAVLRAEPQQPGAAAGLIDANDKKPVLVQINAAAEAAGVRVGMTAPQAQARYASLKIRRRSAIQEKAASTLLLQCAYRFSPVIEATAPGLVTLDWSRFKNVQVEEQAGRIIRQLTRAHLVAQVGVAETPRLAEFAARRAGPFMMVTSATDFLRKLPIEMLEPLPATLRLLRKWGIVHVGDLLALDENELILRLGAEGVDLMERAAAKESRPLHAVLPPVSLEEQADFEGEVESIGPVLLAAGRLLEALCSRLREAGLVAEALHLRLIFSGTDPLERLLMIPAPTADVAVLLRWVETYLEGVRSEHGVKGLQLTVTPGPPQVNQFGLFENVVRDPRRFGESLAQVAAVVGAERVGMPVHVATHRPDTFLLRAVDPNPCAEETEETWPGIGLGLPLRRFRPPWPAVVQEEAGTPRRIESQGLRARVKEARGPWRVSGGWWTEEGWAREEWDVQAEDGALYRIFREAGAWFVDGLYD